MKWFKRKPKEYYNYRLLCRHCDVIFEKIYSKKHFLEKCPMCGGDLETFSATPVGKKIYEDRI